MSNDAYADLSNRLNAIITDSLSSGTGNGDITIGLALSVAAFTKTVIPERDHKRFANDFGNMILDLINRLTVLGSSLQ